MAKWKLTVSDPNVDEPVVTEHATYDELLSHIRATYDPSGYYADEGTGGMQNLLAGEGYEFDYREISG
ncbi:hypothetical protein AN480_27295 (plasmid) [Mycobacterium intracellulare subsp. chimaera]|uniref:Uncharacterized protein n=1 Tax=Mycobacterium intracellulare subsp. chimaera TaxID=222805 RepID=A0ABT7P3A2_MYCIT|nr:hypothetical protein [Mycobacterium intracellulare]AOS94799.1 hypothetical protein AN480_27295 [Mycobacterium intracellulare subsp. chimaera]MDM3927772.1 hypothetical protein [Mycobacterium intracellulare subsp. chimaera]